MAGRRALPGTQAKKGKRWAEEARKQSRGRAAGLDLHTADKAHGQSLEGNALGPRREFQSL